VTRRVAPPLVEDLVARSRRSCFICDVVRGTHELAHHLVYEDDLAIAFLNRYPSLYGYVLVAPKAHREQVTGDFDEDEFVALQRVVYRVGEAVRRAVPTERLYVLSLGSQQGNRHVHWHVAPLPPSIPYEAQQLEALSWRKGILELSEEEWEGLANRIREELRPG
jgi:diadenosine tetraphosphate (Ap4A) HIT family hydrolase